MLFMDEYLGTPRDPAGKSVVGTGGLCRTRRRPPAL